MYIQFVLKIQISYFCNAVDLLKYFILNKYQSFQGTLYIYKCTRSDYFTTFRW